MRLSAPRAIALSLAVTILVAGAAGRAAGQGASLEYQVKAAYLAKFVPFVEWPPGALAPGSAVNLCVAGEDPFGPAFTSLGRQRVGERPVAPRRLARVDAGSGCHVLYVRASPNQTVGEVLAAVRGTPVLTVTDASSGEGARGILHFVVVQNRVRFLVNAQAAAENQLAISSKLQSLALPAGGSR